MQIGCSEVPKPSYPAYFDQLSERHKPLWPEIGIFGHFGPGLAGSFGALLVGWLVVVARGLYLARHLFTLYNVPFAWLYSSLVVYLFFYPTDGHQSC